MADLGFLGQFFNWLSGQEPQQDYPGMIKGRSVPSTKAGPTKVQDLPVDTRSGLPSDLSTLIAPPKPVEVQDLPALPSTGNVDQANVDYILNNSFKDFLKSLETPSATPQDKFLEYVGNLEGNKDPNVVYGGEVVPNLTKMTIQQVLDAQANRSLPFAKGSTAVGAYQFIPETLQRAAKAVGLDTSKDKFSAKNQKKMAEYLLNTRRGFNDFLKGNISTKDFANRVAKEWASLPAPSKGGKSYYHKTGNNKALVSQKEFLSFLEDLKK
jgi:muramidase (phage lysozyme)